MPVLRPSGDMNGYSDYGHNRSSSYLSTEGYDPYRRDDYRDQDDPYNRRGEDIYTRPNRNGYPSGSDRFNTDHLADKNSLDGQEMRQGNDPYFELDHLATFAAGQKTGVLYAQDGFRKLQQMENTTGIWTMRCILVVERKHLVIRDKLSGQNEYERFPIHLIHEPTAICKNDNREIYNNLLLFTILEDPKKLQTQTDMHIFQSCGTPSQDIVDAIIAAKQGRPHQGHGSRIPPPPLQPAPEPPGGNVKEVAARYDKMLDTSAAVLKRSPYYRSETRPFVNGGVMSYIGKRGNFIRDRDDTDSVLSDRTERDVQLLNHCFDDIEKFVARLQQAAEAFKELERRKKERAGKKNKKSSGEGMLSMRAKPPPAKDFRDIFQKFKLSFNLLAKLKAHIHDPNAPELVHFLFTPLSLIFEASRDPSHGSPDLAANVVSPLLTSEARELLMNCLTSKETDLWMSMGEAWHISNEHWKGYVEPFIPRFYDGWQPSASALMEDGPNMAFSAAVRVQAAQIANMDAAREARLRPSDRVMQYPHEDPEERYNRREDPYRRSMHSDGYPAEPTTPPGGALINPQAAGYNEYVEQHINRSKSAQIPNKPRTRAEHNLQFARELKRNRASIYQAAHDRNSKHAKEITLEKEDVLEVLDNSRNWWKVKNYKGDVGHAPYTILKPYEFKEEENTFDSEANERPRGYGYDEGSSPSGDGRRGQKEVDLERYTPMPQAPPTAYIPPPPLTQPPSTKASSQHSSGGGTPPPTKSKNLNLPRPAGMEGSPQFRSKNASRGQPDDLHDELRARMTLVNNRTKQRTNGVTVHISQKSTPEEVAEWLETKAFSLRAISVLDNISGSDLFNMKRSEMDRLLGREEAARLDSQVTVQKNIDGYGTRSAQELRAILQRRKERADTGSSDGLDDSHPSYSADNSDVDSDDYQGSDKTFRDLIRKQRRKINSQSEKI